MKFNESGPYGDIFVVAVLGPILSLVVAIALGTMLGSF